MSVAKRIAFGAAASWFSRGVTIVLGLVLMPVLFRHLPREELGVWLLLGQTWSVMSMLDLGLGFTLTRRIALAKGKSSGEANTLINEETRRDIADLVESGRRIYHWLALGVFLVSSIGGFFYLRQLYLTTLSHSMALTAWIILCLSQTFGIWAQVWNCLLIGVGYVGWDNVLASFISTLTLIFQITAVFCGGGLIALASVATVGALAQRYLLLGFARSRQPELFAIRGNWNAAFVRSMVTPSLLAWLTSLGTVLVLNTDQFFIAQLKGTSSIPAYRAAYLVLLNLNMLSVTVSGASAVFISHLWQAGQVQQVHRLVLHNLRLGLSIMTCGGACVLALGPCLFDFWLKPGHFIGYPVLVIFFLLLTFEAQCNIISTSSRATEDEAFAFWSLAGASLKILFSWWLGVRYGLVGIALGTLLAQLLTSHWFMPYRGLRRLRMSLWQHFLGVLLPVTVLFVVTGAAVWLVRRSLADAPLWLLVGLGALTAGTVFAGALWLLVLDKSQRLQVLNHLLSSRS